MDFITELNRIMEALDLSPMQVAYHNDITEATVYRWRNGTAKPHRGTAKRVIRKLKELENENNAQ